MEGNPKDKLLAQRIIDIDLNVPSPKDRAAFIHGVLKEHAPDVTVWDQVCAFGELLGAFSLAEPGLEEVVKPLLKRIYTIHYFHGKDLKSCLKKSNYTMDQSDSTNEPQLKLMDSSETIQ